MLKLIIEGSVRGEGTVPLLYDRAQVFGQTREEILSQADLMVGSRNWIEGWSAVERHNERADYEAVFGKNALPKATGGELGEMKDPETADWADKKAQGISRLPIPDRPRYIAQALREERDRCAEIALAIDSGRGNEKEIAHAIRKENNEG